MKKIEVVIIEDIKEIAHEVRDLIDESIDFQCKRVYYSAEEAMIFLPQNPPQIVIVDIGLPGMSGIHLIEKLITLIPQTLFCMFTMFEDDDKIFQSLKAGSKGYILKNASPNSILQSIKELYDGGSPMSPTVARKVIEAFSKIIPASKNINSPLSLRETEILNLLSVGLLYKEIGEKLQITTGTVKQHIHKIYDKLHVSNRTEALNKYKNP